MIEEFIKNKISWQEDKVDVWAHTEKQNKD